MNVSTFCKGTMVTIQTQSGCDVKAIVLIFSAHEKLHLSWNGGGTILIVLQSTQKQAKNIGETHLTP